jgi:hypothetical protein
MLEIVAVTDNYRSNPPNPTSKDRLLLKQERTVEIDRHQN